MRANGYAVGLTPTDRWRLNVFFLMAVILINQFATGEAQNRLVNTQKGVWCSQKCSKTRGLDPILPFLALKMTVASWCLQAVKSLYPLIHKALRRFQPLPSLHHQGKNAQNLGVLPFLA